MASGYIPHSPLLVTASEDQDSSSDEQLEDSSDASVVTVIRVVPDFVGCPDVSISSQSWEFNRRIPESGGLSMPAEVYIPEVQPPVRYQSCAGGGCTDQMWAVALDVGEFLFRNVWKVTTFLLAVVVCVLLAFLFHPGLEICQL